MGIKLVDLVVNAAAAAATAGRYLASTLTEPHFRALLTRPDDLEILTLSMDISGEEPQVVCQFSLDQELKWVQRQNKNSWKIPTRDLGVDQALLESARNAPVLERLPSVLTEGLSKYLREAPDAPLWIEFKAPCGYLPLLDWEALLAKAVNRPVLRLCDPASPLPREVSDSLDVVLCASEPRAKPSFNISELVPRLASRILESSPRNKMRLHIFSDAPQYEELQKHTSDRVKVYDPNKPPESSAGETQGENPGENPWLRWMRTALAGTSIDAVHFVCHSYYSRNRGMLALAESPVKNDDYEWARFADAWDLQTFLIQIGAWGLTLSSPPGNFSPVGARQLVQTVAEIRPGCVALHDISADADEEELKRLYRFLYTPGRQSAPRLSAPVYCPPAFVKVTTPASRLGAGLAYVSPGTFGFEATPKDIGQLGKQFEETLRKLQARNGEIPAWLSAAQRYVEQALFELNKQHRELPNATPEARKDWEERRIQVAKIQKATAEMAEKAGAPE
jgi:hypothetical protein